MTTESEANRIVRSVVEQADRAIVSAAEGRRIRALLARADRELAQRLGRVVRGTGGPLTRFTEARLGAYRAQIQGVTGHVEQRLLRETSRRSKAQVERGLKGAVKVIKALERVHRGAPIELALEKAQVLDSLSARRLGSLLMRHQASVDRYGRAMILRMERELATGILLGEQQWQLVERLTGIGRTTGPGMFADSEWMARRIVRTEVAEAHNAVQLDAIVEMRKEFPDTAKKIIATFDVRTAPDSVVAHGQVRDIGELFVDGAGRRYERPPARPNDREVIIPWRKAWPELPATRPRPAEEVAAAKVACMPASTPGPVKRVARKEARAAVRAEREKNAVWREQAARLYGP